MLALIDGDIIVYRSGFAAERTRYTAFADGSSDPFWDDYDYRAMMRHIKEHDIEEYEVARTREVEPVENALNNAKIMMESILRDPLKGGTGADQYYLALSGGYESFRHKLATLQPYKENRKDAPKPKHYSEVRKYLINQWGAVEYTSVEADDILGLGQLHDPRPTVICSIDKDLLQIEGHHFHLVDKRLFYVDPFSASLSKYKQLLTGDATDNIPGIKGVGPRTALKILEGCESEEAMYNAVLGAWADAGYDNPKEVVDELNRLVTIGGDDASKALIESGEIEKVRSLQVTAGAGSGGRPEEAEG